jgi:hypothetical protein
MRKTSLVALMLLASLLLTIQPVAAASATMNITVLGGGGSLSDSTTFAVQGMSLAVANPGHPVSQSVGNLVLNGVHTSCTVDSVVGCSEATLTCADSSTHTVTAGVPGTSLGNLDGVDVATGFVFMQCISH